MSYKTLMNWLNELRCDYFTWADCLIAKHNNSTLEEFRVFYGLDRSHAQHLDEWLRFALSKRVERLELNLAWRGDVDIRNHHAYTFPYKRVVGEGFSFLKKLSTSYVNVGGEAVEGLLRNCPHLQQLSLDHAGDLTSLEIVSTFPSFKRLEICMCLSLTSLVIRDSSIVCLRVYTGIRIQHVALTNVPLLTELTLGNLPLVDLGDMFSSVLPQIRMLELFIDRIDLSEEESRNFCSRIELSNLKQFVVVDDGRNDLKEIVVGDEGRVETPLTPLIHLLNASPRLEKFVVKSAQYLDDWEYERKSEEDIPFYKRGKIPRAERKTARAEVAARKTPTLYPCLKEVEWVGYVDMESYFEMVMHLVGNGVALENIVVDQRDLVFKLHGWWDFYPPHKTTPRLQAMADALRNYVPSRINLNIIS